MLVTERFDTTCCGCVMRNHVVVRNLESYGWV